jgi:hypothetical protein
MIMLILMLFILRQKHRMSFIHYCDYSRPYFYSTSFSKQFHGIDVSHLHAYLFAKSNYFTCYTWICILSYKNFLSMPSLNNFCCLLCTYTYFVGLFHFFIRQLNILQRSGAKIGFWHTLIYYHFKNVVSRINGCTTLPMEGSSISQEIYDQHRYKPTISYISRKTHALHFI